MVKKKDIETADHKTNMETPEQTLVKHPDTNVVLQTETVVVFQAKFPLTDSNYELLQKWIRNENEQSGIKIVFAPASVDVKAGEA